MADLTEVLAPEIERLQEVLQDIEFKVESTFSLADAIREGSTVTGRLSGWYQEAKACALGAAAVSLVSRGVIK